ncbi:hypothetical protein P7D22_08470 [Lichenihabitans sp. Uapishka_5]|uniref:hypothetical protein n=1 Tax=Lichenihabitans sp. Uapishka_5 TaxID=3037302 RepID=UPI0029E7EC47|nr:hypothetical protein [Lichenihabitans sp. Uapishka_5]MDX7951210.1 hypothetical protein [Lichenihabitans sp. Uapishka_5]
MFKHTTGVTVMMAGMFLAPADAATKTDLHGIALGMTADQVIVGAHLPCQTPPYSSDIACTDGSDGSDYRAAFSGGLPSVVLTVARSFCSPASPAVVLGGMLNAFGKGRRAAAPDPNGYHVDLDATTEAILSADDGSCPAGRGRHYVVALRSNALIEASSRQALDRAKKALR